MDRSGFLQEFMPHGMCYLWRLDILLTHVVSDAFIAIAYFLISIALYFFLRQRPDMPFRHVIVLFSIFIFSCGLTHVFAIWTVWNGDYGIQGVLKAATAIASVATACVLVPLMPRLMALRSPKELEAANMALEHEISERQTIERETRRLEADLAHSDRVNTMGQMATGLAHELNQPLTSLVQNADTLRTVANQGGSIERDLLDVIDEMDAQAYRAGEIISALRQFVTKDNTSRSILELDDLILQTLRLMEPQALKLNVKVEYSDQCGAQVLADRVQITQVLVNLVKNAMEAAHAPQGGGLVGIHCSITGSMARVKIVDNGPGISPEVDVFARFGTDKAGGMGLGLSISKSIIEAHEGRIWHTQSERGGTRFVFELPARAGSDD